jgi:hypothetical protein
MEELLTDPACEEESEERTPPREDDELGHFWLDLGDPVG